MNLSKELQQLKKRLKALKDGNKNTCSGYIHQSAINRLQEIEELEEKIRNLAASIRNP